MENKIRASMQEKAFEFMESLKKKRGEWWENF
jgi:hypothetical protein